MRPPWTPLACACLLAAALAVGVAGCGGGSDPEGGGKRPAPPQHSTPAPPKSAFPATEGRTLRQILKQGADRPAELKVEPQAMVFEVGENRYPFGVFEKSKAGQTGAEVEDAEVALYYAKVPAAGKRSKPGVKGAATKASEQALDQPAVGPFPARIETLATEPRFESKTTSGDPDAARVVYSARVPLPGRGQWRLAALIREGNQIGAITQLPSANAGEYDAIPRIGQAAPRIHTPTAQEADGDASKITTRIPPDTQNEVDYANALGKEPILLLFATPKFCQSRVCSPVVDVAEQAKAKYGNEARFIHMEIYSDKNPNNLTVLPQVRAFHLPSEPWLFAIGADGVVRAAVEGGFGTEQMDEAVKKAVAK
jgi:hypothetical protein